MNADPIEDAIKAYGDVMTVMEPYRLKIWEERGLTVSQLRLTYLIRSRQNPSLGELADELKITGATMSGLIDRLARRDLVERKQDPADRRVVRVHLTSEGERVSRQLQQTGHDLLRVALEKVGPEVSAELASKLRQFGAAVADVLADGSYVDLLHDNEEQKLP